MERLVQELAKCHIDTHSIIINQVLFSTPGENRNACRRCASGTRLYRTSSSFYSDRFN